MICKDDIIGKHASITYEDSFINLTNFLALPVDQWPVHNRGTGEDCYVLPPFEVQISSRGTANLIELVSKSKSKMGLLYFSTCNEGCHRLVSLNIQRYLDIGWHPPNKDACANVFGNSIYFIIIFWI